MVALPVSGLRVEVRPPRGADEVFLLEAPSLDAGLALALLARVARSTEDERWGALTLTDLDTLLLELRREVFGDWIRTDTLCPAEVCRWRTTSWSPAGSNGRGASRRASLPVPAATGASSISAPSTAAVSRTSSASPGTASCKACFSPVVNTATGLHRRLALIASCCRSSAARPCRESMRRPIARRMARCVSGVVKWRSPQMS